MAIEYRRERDVAPEEVAAVFEASGIRRPADDLERIGRMVKHANLIICARDAGRLVGIARSLTDYSFCCYLSDLAVDRDYQRQGIGKALIRLTQDAVGPQSMLLLLAAPQAKDYYRHIGFEHVDRAWMLDRWD
jgi:ribosomal protein S18 acetylase RimI-like enzyme